MLNAPLEVMILYLAVLSASQKQSQIISGIAKKSFLKFIAVK